MKALLLALTFLVSSGSYAFDVCQFAETYETGLVPSKIVKSKARYTFQEKNLIHRTLTQENFQRGFSRDEAIEHFRAEGNDGEIQYFDLGKKQLILVHYFPGDNEYGAFYEVLPSRHVKLVATVGDSFISCIQE